MNDAVNHPQHYTQGGIECIDALEAATVGLTGIEAICTANAIKYLWRWKHKNGVQDIDKAIWYLNRLKAKLTTKKTGYCEYWRDGCCMAQKGMPECAYIPDICPVLKNTKTHK